MADPQVNFFSSTLVGTYSDTDTSLTIANGSGAKLPDPSVDGEFNLVIFNESEIGVVTTFDGGSTDTREDLGGTNPEIVRVTAKSGDVLTVTRGQEGTSASAKQAGNTYRVILSATKKVFDDIQTAIDNVDLTTLTGVEELTFDTTGDEEFGLPSGTTAQRPSNPANGYMRYNTTEGKAEVYASGEWRSINTTDYPKFFGGRAVFGGGYTGASRVDTIDYVSIQTAGNATDFGNLVVRTQDGFASSSNSIRCIFSGGQESSYLNRIDYITIATTGNASGFGSLTVAREGCAGCSDGITGLTAGGYTGSDSNVIDYVTIDTTGNAVDFGNLTSSRRWLGACSGGGRGVFGGGLSNNTMDYVTISTTSNATDFGDLGTPTRGVAGCSDGSRGLFGGGDANNTSNAIHYITIATTGNSTAFGNLSVATRYTSSSSDGSRGLFGGGQAGGSATNRIEFVTIQTTGNGTDFGDLTQARYFATSSSGD